MATTLRLERNEGGVAHLVMDLEDRSMNVLTPLFIEELAGAVEEIAADEGITGVVLCSAKKTFMAGADLKNLGDLFDVSGDAAAALNRVGRFSAVLRRMETCGKPFVAAINHTALGGGLELALACHGRIAANEPKSKIGLPEVTIGLLPGGGGTQRLPRLIGVQASLELMTRGTHLNPPKAAELGIVDRVVEPDALVAAAEAWLADNPAAEQPWDVKGFKIPGGSPANHPGVMQTFMAGAALVAKETRRNYPAPLSILSCVYEGTIVPMDTGLRIEARYFLKLLRDPVAHNMVRTLFVNKQAADKLARRPEGVPKLTVAKLGVLGAGMMGAGIAYAAAKVGIEVVLLDRDEASAAKGKDYSRGVVAKLVEKGRLTKDRANDLLGRIQPTTDYAELAGAQLVIEAVFEDRSIKADVTKKAEAVLGPEAIFASNTSTLPITGLAKASSRPERFIGLHFFSPVEKMPLVEVIVGEDTSQETIAQSLDFVQQIRKTPIVVNDSRGFYTSRVFSTFAQEGVKMLSEGIAPALIENVAKQAGMPVGPLAVSDEVSIELLYKIEKQTRADLGEAYVAGPAWPVAQHFVEELGRLGRKSGAGFYDYPENGPKRLWSGLADVYPPLDQQPTVDEIRDRLMYRQALETARCLEEGVLTHAEDADIGSIFGWGFPAYTGGTASFIDTLGMSAFVKRCDELAERYGERFAVSDAMRSRAQSGETYFGSGSRKAA